MLKLMPAKEEAVMDNPEQLSGSWDFSVFWILTRANIHLLCVHSGTDGEAFSLQDRYKG